MPAQHKSTTYRETEITNPFHDGGDKAYGDILRDKMRETRWWRLVVGLGTLGIALLNLFFFIYAVSLQKTVPVLVNVMPTGEAAYIGEVRQKSGAAAAPEAAIVFQVRKFVTNLRTIPVDYQVLYNNITDCYAMVTSKYEPVLTQALRANSPFDIVGKERRTLEIESAIKITGASYQVDWTETSVETSGSPKRRRMRALVTVTILPVSGEAMKANPLGIYIEDFEMTEL